LVNKHAKGNRRELEARKQLESAGYLVEKKNYSRFADKDFWNTFDIIALKKDGSEIRLIQVKSNISDFYSARKDILDWMSLNEISNIDCEVWLREDRCPWRKETICLH